MSFGGLDFLAYFHLFTSPNAYVFAFFLIFRVCSSHNSPFKFSWELEIRYVHSVGTLDVPFGGLHILTPLNPFYPFYRLGNSHDYNML